MKATAKTPRIWQAPEFSILAETFFLTEISHPVQDHNGLTLSSIADKIKQLLFSFVAPTFTQINCLLSFSSIGTGHKPLIYFP